MKIIVFSDSHRDLDHMRQVVEREQPDTVIHLGDHERDAEILRTEFPHIPLYTVCGNCDLAPSSPLTDVVPLGPVKAFITHGHAYNVNWSVDRLVYAAQEAGAKLALFGHTHEPMNVEIGGVQVLNPGTAGKGRRLTWAMITVFDNGGVACEIRDL